MAERVHPKIDGRSFLKFFIIFLAGSLGLSLNLSFPSIPLDWLVMVFVWAYLDIGKFLAFLLVLLLSFLYSSFSLTPAWQIALPFLLGILSFEWIRKNIALTSIGSGILLMACLLACKGLFWALFFGGPHWLKLLRLSDFLWALGTIIVGNFLLPFAFSLGVRTLTHLPFLKRRWSSYSFAKWQTGRIRSGRLRKPFGLEKGI